MADTSTRERPLVPYTRTWGVLLALATALVSGFAVFINGYGVRAWTAAGASSSTYTTAKNLVAALVLIALLAVASRRRRGEGLTRPQRPSQWLGLIAVGAVGGSVAFLLFFEGLARASSGQAAFIHKTLVIWVALLAVPLLGERLGVIHIAAIGLLVWGQALLVGGVGEISLGSGEFMILAATLMWSIEVVIAKRLLRDLSPLTVGTARMTIGVVTLIAFLVLSGGGAELAALGAGQWSWVLATGIVLSAFVATWYSALARAQAVDVTAVLVFGAVITGLLRAGLQDAALPPVAGLVLVALGASALATWQLMPRRRLTPYS